MSIEGTWFNELGSEMVFRVNGTSISGTYETKVGDAAGIYQLNGALDDKPNVSGQAIGFVVAWVNQAHGSSHSVTSWSGQYQTIDGEEVIITFWLLTAETDPQNDWESTLIGKDIFTRFAPSQSDVTKRLKLGPASHPLRKKA